MKPVETYISLCGHAKHGKSTLAGRLIYEFGGVDEASLNKYRQEAINLINVSKDYNEYSLIFLRHRSSAKDPSRTEFPERGRVILENNQVLTLIDTPGYSRFLDNIVYGIYLADLSIIIIEASGGVKSGTITVARILSHFGIPIIAFLVTKMDVVGYSQLRFNQIKEQLEKSMSSILPNLGDNFPPIIPVSALSGAGFSTAIPELDWYSGNKVLDEIKRSLALNAPDKTGNVRFAVEGSQEIFSPRGVGTVLVGTLENGKIETGQELIIEPASTIVRKPITIEIRSLQRARTVTEPKSENMPVISARAIVAVATTDLSVSDASDHLRHGGMLGLRSDPPNVANQIEAEIIFFEPNTVYSGKEYIFLANASNVIAHIQEIKSKDKIVYDLEMDEFDAVVHESVSAALRFKSPFCIEASPNFQRLSLFVLREENRIVACGRCTKIIK